MSDDFTKEIVDSYKEHSQHFEFVTDCSECYSNLPKVLIDKTEEIINNGELKF